MNILAPIAATPGKLMNFHNGCVELRVQYLRPSYICLKSKEDNKLAKHEKSTILDDILSEGMIEEKKVQRDTEMNIAKMEIPES